MISRQTSHDTACLLTLLFYFSLYFLLVYFFLFLFFLNTFLEGRLSPLLWKEIAMLILTVCVCVCVYDFRVYLSQVKL